MCGITGNKNSQASSLLNLTGNKNSQVFIYLKVSFSWKDFGKVVQCDRVASRIIVINSFIIEMFLFEH